MEFFLNFDKKDISAKVMEFLEINIDQEDDKKSFARILKGNKLYYKEANLFIETLLRALTIEDGKEDKPFSPRKASDEGLGDDPTLSQLNKMNEASNNLPEKNPPPGAAMYTHIGEPKNNKY